MKRTIIALVAAAALALPAMAKQREMQQDSSTSGRIKDRDDQTMSRGGHTTMRARSARAVDHHRDRDWAAGYFLRYGVGYAGGKDYDNPRYYRGRGEYDRDRYRRHSSMSASMNNKGERGSRTARIATRELPGDMGVGLSGCCRGLDNRG